MVKSHYEKIAKDFEKKWFFGEDYVPKLTEAISKHLFTKEATSFLDIGCGTGMYTNTLSSLNSNIQKIVGVDLSSEMIRKFSANFPDFEGYCGQLSTLAQKDMSFDSILLKEAIHHFEDKKQLFRDVSKLLSKDGIFLIVTRPQVTEFPFFERARKVFLERQPSLEEIVDDIDNSLGLKADVAKEGVSINLTKKRWIEMVRSRFMSTFTDFSEQELGDGLREIEETNPDELNFIDQFLMIKISKS